MNIISSKTIYLATENSKLGGFSIKGDTMKKEKVPSTYKYNDITCNDTGERVHDYNTYMLTEHWKVLRERIAYNKNYKCDICGKHVKKCFQVHHKWYHLQES